MKTQLFFKAKHIHFIGLGGIGVSSLAQLSLVLGKKVSGSDLSASPVIRELEEKKVQFFLGHSAQNISQSTDLVIYSSAVPVTNPERQEAKKKGIPELSYFQALGELSQKWPTISVAGTHGKSTTTALIGRILQEAGMSPLVILGAKVLDWQDNFFYPAKTPNYFVVESCEWQANFLNINPSFIVLTNLEEDHLDYYKDINHLKDTFNKFIKKLKTNGWVFSNIDSKNLLSLNYPSHLYTYGLDSPADLMAQNITVQGKKQNFDLIERGKFLANIDFNLLGRFNVYNALSAVSLGLKLGAPLESIKKVLNSFKGLGRRFETAGKMKNKNVLVVSDYAHHPTALRETLTMARQAFPHRRIFLVYQPHQKERTKKLFQKFVDSFWQADLVVLSEIYFVPGRESDIKISSKDLVEEIKKSPKFKKTPLKEIVFAKNLDKTVEFINKKILPGDLLLVAGAGDIYKIISRLDLE